MAYEITRRQTTFWDLQRHDGRVERVHFLGKEESGFVDDYCLSFSIVEEHPLLIDYRWKWTAIYLAGPVADFQQVLRRLEETVAGEVGTWRAASQYFNSVGAERILREGYGELLGAPTPVAELCQRVLREAGARFSTLPRRGVRWPRQAFIAGANYVVARSFRVEIVT